ncbi:MAG: hypothetical protein WCG44_04490 [bacterium]
MDKVEIQKDIDISILEYSNTLDLNQNQQGQFLNQCSSLLEIVMGYKEASDPSVARFIKRMKEGGPMDREMFLATIVMMQIAQVDILRGYWDSE